MSKTVISVANVSKNFRIPLDRSTTLKYKLTHPKTSSRYRIMSALNDVSFDIHQGEFVGIIGENGSGKSTLLKVLARIYSTDIGSLMIDGLVSPFLELGVGFNPDLTARENIFLGGAVLGMTRKYLAANMDRIINFAGGEVIARVDDKVKNFSSGMQVRLAFALAVQSYADILLMDEVLAVGDATFQARCLDVFTKFKREGKTIILVSHDLSSIRQYCDRVLLMEKGRLAADGNPREVIGQYMRQIGEAAEASQTEAAPARAMGATVGIAGVHLTSALADRPTTTFYSGKPFEISARLANKTAHDVTTACGGAIYRLDGTEIATFSMGSGATPSVVLPAGREMTVSFAVPSLPILSGSYYMSFEAKDPSGTPVYDRLNEAAQFHVLDEAQRPGIVAFEGAWSERSAAATPAAG